MAIKGFKVDLSKDTIEVVLQMDSSIECSEEEYADYLKDLDESKLKIKADEEPTRFVLRKALPYGLTQKLKDSQLKISPSGEANFQMGSIMDEVRFALMDVKNPTGCAEEDKIKFTKDGDGHASRDLVAALDNYGELMHLYTARQNAAAKHKAGDLLKKLEALIDLTFSDRKNLKHRVEFHM